ncbi:HD domain-containing phosphohydrolase [Desulfonatronospira sp. MSAO_Bac3]|uniref:HD domain-containing phosphohydrolase n=1 Tax=Desulfonatronospira sp. MSAO_Bac3 TaxID=2293857 RepID=UPI002580D7B2|nr:HD domain-containing phosphohydrolase [Desulfonatronospira sp. MSAO_Bac3]
MKDYKVLFVDDDVNILEGFKRSLRRNYSVDTATGAMEGLKAINEKGPYAVVVADLKMPGMDGIQFLGRVRELFPESVRIMLTGHGDLDAAIEAINEGSVFRFLTKPVPPHLLTRTLDDAIAQYRLIVSEKEIMESTVSGVVGALTDVLSMVNEDAMARAARIKRFVRDLAVHMGETDVWFYETGALLSQIGGLALPENIRLKIKNGEKLTPEEKQTFSQHPMIAADIISRIPRLEEMSRMISQQEKYYNGQGFPEDGIRGKDIPLGARILKVVLDYDLLMNRGYSRKNTLLRMLDRKGRYDPAVIRNFIEVLQMEDEYELKQVRINDLVPYMVVTEEIYSLSGMLLLRSGSELSLNQVDKLRNLDETYGVKQPFSVLVPPQKLREKKKAKESG